MSSPYKEELRRLRAVPSVPRKQFTTAQVNRIALELLRTAFYIITEGKGEADQTDVRILEALIGAYPLGLTAKQLREVSTWGEENWREKVEMANNWLRRHIMSSAGYYNWGFDDLKKTYWGFSRWFDKVEIEVTAEGARLVVNGRYPQRNTSHVATFSQPIRPDLVKLLQTLSL